ncbi:MAG: hypothetical protein GXO76_05715 [Calditrichaeota bacterium]|nr:hypothetical protein [Calditrichota bacterium]
MRILLIGVVFLFLSGTAETVFSQVRLSEIMFDPAGSEYYDEFIEIQNRSLRDTISLSGWRVGDEKSLDLIKDAGGGLKLAPGQFGIILDSGYFSHSTTYDSLIPEDALVLTIADNSFGSGGLSNSVAEKVSLVNTRGDTVDAYRYTLDNRPGHSDEKINIFQDSPENNWANSLQLNGTPGFKNSVALSARDLALVSVNWDSVLLQKEGEFSGTAVVRNVGTTPASDSRLVLFEDKDLDGRFTSSEQRGLWPIGRSVLPNKKVSIALSLGRLSPGIHSFLVLIDWPGDENPSNNSRKVVGVVQFSPDVLRVNEIMYRPFPGFPEWVEIKNISPDTLQLYRWRFSDETTTHGVTLFDTPQKLPPGNYWILAQAHIPDLPDSLAGHETLVRRWPTLNNSGDQVWIFDPTGLPLDHVDYSRWPETSPGHSLERLEYSIPSEHREGWQASRVEGGTPGCPNSINPLLVDGKLTCLDPMPVLSKAADSAGVSLLLKNQGRLEISGSRIVMFDDRNDDGFFSENECLEQETRSVGNLPPGDSVFFRMAFSGLAPGKHKLLAEWRIPGDQDSENNSGRIEIWKGYRPFTLLINEVMYRPRPGWPEWVEIYNPGENRIPIQDWSVCDHRALAKEASLESGAAIFPGDFLVVAGDSSFFAWYPEVNPDRVVIDKKFPTLNNDRDSLFLVDLSGTISDELAYTSSWGGRNGRSLERIRPGNIAADSTNWSTSVAGEGSTPGCQNSIVLHTTATNHWLSISPNPFSPDGDGKDDFVTFTIHTKTATSVAELRVFDAAGRMVRTLLDNQPIGSSYECIWDGRQKNGKILPMGIYIAYLELFVNRKKQRSLKKTFVLAKHL